MGKQKLTLLIPTKTARRAKVYARRRGTTVSALVSRWFDAAELPPGEAAPLTPMTAALSGILPSTVDEKKLIEDAVYERHFR